MDINQKNYNWNQVTDFILLHLNKRVYICSLLFLKLMFVGLFIQNFLTMSLEIFHIPYIIPFCLFLIIIFIYFLIKISSRTSDMITYLLIILFFDALIIFVVIVAYLVESEGLFIRGIYIELCFSLIYLNINFDYSSIKIRYLMIYKALIIVIFLILYNYKKNIENFFILDLYMIIFSLGMILIIININSILSKELKELYNNNVSVTNNINSIFNAMKTSLISFNYNRNLIHFNASFIQFMKDTLSYDHHGIRFLLNEIKEEQLSNEYLSSLVENISKDDLDFLEKLIINEDNEVKKIKLISWKKRILILNKIFSGLFRETEINKTVVFNIFELIKPDKIFEQKEYFQLIGEFNFISPEEHIFEVSGRKCFNNTDEETLEIMINQKNISKEVKFNNSDIKNRNIFIQKIAHKFKNEFDSLIYSINDLIENHPQIKDSKDEKLKNQVEFIKSQSNFITILIHDINDYCKDVKDLDINLELVEIRVVMKFAFEILRCLLSKDQYKKDNVKFNLNISDNVPQFINTDEKRLKQLLINLISNSVKFTNFGHINLNVDYAPKINENTFNELKFCIEDTGIGIKKEDQSKLFQDYSDVNKDFFKMNKEGTGIGLSICKKIIQKLGSNISCESENKITHFKFSVYNFNDCKLPILQESLIHDEETLLIKYPYQDINKIKLDYKKRNFLSSKLVTKKFTKLDFKELPNSERNKSNLNQDSHSNLINSFELNEIFESKLEEEIKFVSSKSINNNFKIPQNKNISSNALKKTTSKKSKNEEKLLKFLENDNFNKTNYLTFSKPFIKYLKHISNGINDLEFSLIVDDENINCHSFYRILSKYNEENDFIHKKIIILNDGIEALNLIYYDTLFNMKILTIFCDLNMNFLNGDMLFEIINKVNAFKRIKFVLYTNMDSTTVRQNVKGIKYVLNKPCCRKDIENLFNSFRET